MGLALAVVELEVVVVDTSVPAWGASPAEDDGEDVAVVDEKTWPRQEAHS